LSAFPTPYTGRAKRRQIARSLTLGAAVVGALATAGCSTFALPFGPRAAGVSMETTAAIPASGSTIGPVDPSDWEAVRRTVAPIPTGENRTVDWTNPDTRSTGAVSVGVAQSGKIIAVCRAFATTVNDAYGVHIHRGQACRDITGRWQLKGVTADDAIRS
jgi:surface antigen